MAEDKIKLYLMGVPELQHNGTRVNFDTRKALALLAYLVVTCQNQSRNTLAALLWGDQSQTSARSSLRRTLSTLNKGLGGEGTGLTINREVIGLEIKLAHPFWSDVTEFNRCIKTARQKQAGSGKPESSVAALLERAVELWRGEFMQGFSLRDAPEFEEWQNQVGENLRRDMVWALEKLAGWLPATGQLEAALMYSRRWLNLDPLNEAAHCQVMRILAWQGQTGLALKQYQNCVRILEKELGVPPLDATTTLYQTIKEQRFEPFEATSLTNSPAPNVPGQAPEIEYQTGTEFPLVGREKERQILEEVGTAVLLKANGQIAVVEGEAGIGKTRLIEDFLAGKQEKGWSITRVNCYEGENSIAFQSVRSALHNSYADRVNRGKLVNLRIDWRTEAARLNPELGEGHAPAASLDNPGAQSRFFEGLYQALLALLLGEGPDQSPGMLFFDDLQWMDASSLDFLLYLANRLAGKSLLLILAWRTGALEVRPGLKQLLTMPQRAKAVSFLHLNRLSKATVQTLVESDYPGKPELADFLYTETEGLPYFIIEYLKAYRQGLLEPEPDPSSLKTGSGQTVPVGVWNLLESRLRSLSDLAQQLLQSAAVIGQGFDYDTLREVSGRSEDETVTGLEELSGAAIITELLPVSSELRYDFSHEKLRSFVYDKTSPVRRRLLHRRVAQALTNPRNTAPKEQSYIQIAYHYRQAGEPDRAAGYYKLAGDYARSLFANRQALTHYQEALNLGYTDTGWLHETMGDLYTLLGEYQPALHQYLLATPPNGHLARLEYKVGTVYLWRGDWKLAISQFEIASELPDLNPGLEARIYTDWGLALHRLNKDKEALELAQKALGKANSGMDETSQARIYNLLGLLAGHRGEPDLAAEHLQKSLNLSEKLGDQALQAASLNNLAWVARTANEFNRAIELTSSALNIVSNLGDRHRQAALLSNLGDLYQATGQFEKARELVKQSILIYTEIGVEAGAFQPGIWMLTEW